MDSRIRIPHSRKRTPATRPTVSARMRALALLLPASIAMVWLSSCQFSTANFAEVSLARSVKDGAPVDVVTGFTGADPVYYCTARMANTPEGTKVKAVWRTASGTGDAAIDSAEVTVDADGWVYFSLTPVGAGLPYGNYAVDLSINGALKDTRPFAVAPRLNVGPIREAAISTRLNESFRPETLLEELPASDQTIYAPVYVEDAAEGTQLAVIWNQRMADGTVNEIATTSYTASGTGWIGFSLKPTGALPPGPYEVDLFLNGAVATRIPFTVTR